MGYAPKRGKTTSISAGLWPLPRFDWSAGDTGPKDVCMGETAVIGFGEAAQAFAHHGWRAFDVIDKRADGARHGVLACATHGEAVCGARVILSLVTADAALAAARETAKTIDADALYLDMNSVAPATKQSAAVAIEATGGRYADVAVMAPVHPARRAVPLLVSGPHAQAARDALDGLGFTDVRIVLGDVGQASSIKMIRSVMVKGIEALTAEMMLAGEAAGVSPEVLASLGDGWSARAAYNIERMTTHGARRAAEMEEVAKTLASLGIDPVMTRGTIARQRAAGSVGKLQDIAA
jgi:3-hydroxyisobutyrate dehydrogenase-like beta-hydroxyacid dehydrogenase